jgi:thiamine biosynthesis lipoprotein
LIESRPIAPGAGMVGPRFIRFPALGCAAVVGVAAAERLDAAREAVQAEVEACDASCSRFREDSELSRLNASGRLDGASPWLIRALTVALAAAQATSGLVDPTVGQTLIDLGYDRSFERIDPDVPLLVRASHVPAWRSIRLHPARHRVTLPAGVRVDLGATAKALCADLAARRAAAAAGTGVLVSLGGDIAVAGQPPSGGWVVRVAARADADPADPGAGPTVAIHAGGLATSGTAARRWKQAGRDVHHLIDPRTGQPAAEVWRTVTVAAPSCVEANAASTAAAVVGAGAPRWLAEHKYDARLVAADGGVVVTGAWPVDAAPETVPA